MLLQVAFGFVRIPLEFKRHWRTLWASNRIKLGEAFAERRERFALSDDLALVQRSGSFSAA